MQRSEERLQPRHRAAEDEGVDVVGALVGVHGLQVLRVAHHVVLFLDPVPAVHVARHAGDVERLAAVVALDDGDHLRRQPPLVEQAADAQAALEAERDVGHHVGQLLLDQLGLGQRLAELVSVEHVLPGPVEAVLGRPHRPPRDAVACAVEAAERPLQAGHVRQERRLRHLHPVHHDLARDRGAQAELAADYYVLRGYDAQSYVYKQSIDYYKKSLEIVTDQFNGKIASELDVARVKYLLHDTEAKAEEVKADREVTEHAIAALVNVSASSFKITPVGELHMAKFTLPRTVPSSLLERRPDVASAEREMAQANRAIGIARAAFFPNVVFRLGGGYEDKAFNLFSLANSAWAYGSMVSLPIFEGGMRRAELQQSWSIYRETEDKYRATVLGAFREVEDGMSLTNRLTEASKRQDLAVAAALEQQNLTMELFRGGLISSLDLVYAQINTLEARINAVKIKARLLESAVLLVRALGGGWNRERLPKDKEIQPFEPFQYTNLDKPAPVGEIDVPVEDRPRNDNLTGSER